MQHFERTLHCPYIATLRRHYGGNEREVIYPGFAPYITHHISEHARMDFGPGSSWITSRSGRAKDFWGDMPSQIIPGVCVIIFLPNHPTVLLPNCRETKDLAHRQTGVLMKERGTDPSDLSASVS